MFIQWNIIWQLKMKVADIYLLMRKDTKIYELKKGVAKLLNKM